MYQFFVDENQVCDNTIYIENQDFNHMKNVVRLKPLEKLRVSTKDGHNYYCELTRYEELTAVLTILSEDTEGTELKGKIQLFQGLPKGDKMELIIQKAVELGVTQIIPVRMKNCVVKLDDKKAAAKVSRWQAIAQAAAKQSKRSFIPTVSEVMNYSDALEYARTNRLNIVPYENEEGIQESKKILASIQPTDEIGIFIGPEGGFDDKEIETARKTMKTISLGKRILRTETAAITTLALVMMQMEE